MDWIYYASNTTPQYRKVENKVQISLPPSFSLEPVSRHTLSSKPIMHEQIARLRDIDL
jgi:hypothetical protein